MAEFEKKDKKDLVSSKDAKATAKNIKDINDKERVQLQYLDKQGHKLTLKEAYRQMCWKFHGRMPSHKKREK